MLGIWESRPLEETLLGSLNGERDFVKEFEIYSLLASREPEDKNEPRQEEHPSDSAKLVIAVLRDLVDTWIKSGIGSNGVEVPKDRKLTDHKSFRAFQGWLLNNPPAPFLTKDGDLQLKIGRPRGANGYAPLTHAAFSEGRTLFLRFLNSPIKYSLFKCRHPSCGVYFTLAKPRNLYSWGPVCPEHRRQQGTIRKRKQDHAQAIQIATEALASWPKLSRSTRAKHKNEKHYVASKLTRFGIGAKWVTRNLTEIKNAR